jgi:arabinogalactan oligomer/maltooligosaccharide transport system permease protein
MSETTLAPTMSATKPAKKYRKSFFYGGREDSPFKRLMIHLTLILACLIAIYPLLRVFSVSLRPGDRLFSTDLSIIPPDATLDAYKNVLDPSKNAFITWVWNSLAITVATSLIGVILAATSAYAFSRYKFPGRSVGMVFLLTTQMIPAAMLMVPLYILAIRLELVGTFRGLVVAYSVTAVPFSIWILKGYYDTIPIDLEEAAKIDGASEIVSFIRILLPLSTPALAIVFLYNFTAAWNEYLLARVVLGSQETLLTWPLGIQRMQDQFNTQWANFSAASILVTVPTMLLFLYSSKWLISGLTLGGVKG